MSETLTINQAAEYIQTQFGEKHHPSNFYRWLREHKIKGYRIGGQWRLFKESIDTFFCPNINETPSQVDNRQ